MAKQWGVEAAVRIYSLRRTRSGRERLGVDMLPQNGPGGCQERAALTGHVREEGGGAPAGRRA